MVHAFTVATDSGKLFTSYMVKLWVMGYERERSTALLLLTSIYLHADPEKRGQQIKDLEDSKFLTKNSIIGGDFNCVENTK
eukprot:scaffold16068_cov113-Isochrysis_galbana.AAC.9